MHSYQFVYTGPPINISVFSPSSRKLIVSWDSPDDPEEIHGNILSYTIVCGASITNIPTSEEVMEMLFDGLLPFTPYNCCVSMETTKANSSAACQKGVTLEEGTVNRDILNPYSGRDIMLRLASQHASIACTCVG